MTSDLAAMIAAYPREIGQSKLDEDVFTRWVQECLNCVQASTMCADACLVAPDPQRRPAACVNAALNCADVVHVSVRAVSRVTGRDTGVVRAVLQACVEACRVCYDECRKFALDYEFCRVCAEACLRCARECSTLLASLDG